jgi:hypothetical protein
VLIGRCQPVQLAALSSSPQDFSAATTLAAWKRERRSDHAFVHPAFYSHRREPSSSPPPPEPSLLLFLLFSSYVVVVSTVLFAAFVVLLRGR